MTDFNEARLFKVSVNKNTFDILSFLMRNYLQLPNEIK